MKKREMTQWFCILLLRGAILVTVLFLAWFLYLIFSQGGSKLTWEFFSQPPRNALTTGGILPAIIGTLYLTLLSVAVALPLGVLTAVYLTNYAGKGYFVRIVRVAINTLAGVPSVIYGLFGLAIFVNMFNFGVSILSGSLTLAVLILPIIINNTEEAIKTLPPDFAEASLALGANKRQTIMRIILPASLPNILTGTILSIGRAAGETAPIIFTAATFYINGLPKSIFDEVMAMPFHIYGLMAEGTDPELQVPIAYGTACVLMILVLAISATAIIIRYRMRKTRKW